jgi:hypothetical protein
MSIAEELLKLLPKEWMAEIDEDEGLQELIYEHHHYGISGCNLEEGEDCPILINWALDELAKTGRQPHIGVFPNIHTMENMWYVKWTPRGIEDVAQTNQHPTKTLALAHALIALGENDG